MKPFFERPAYAVALACGFTFAVFAPTVMRRPDSFPLSTYPMFAKHRGRPAIVKLLATTPTGSVPVPPQLLGTGEVLQAKVLLEQIASKPASKREKFCQQTARRLANLAEAATWQELELVRVKYDPIDYFYNDARPMSHKVLATCSLRGATKSQPLSRSPQSEQAPDTEPSSATMTAESEFAE